MNSAVRGTGVPALKLTLLVVAMLAVVVLVAGCSATSRVSSGTTFDSNSNTAVVILGTRIADYDDTTNYRKVLEPILFQTHWQAYDTETLRLVPGDSLAFSERNDDVFYSDDALKHWEISTTEIPAGSYALTSTFLHRTITVFMKGARAEHDLTMSGISIMVHGEVDPAKHFHFEAKPGQVIYLGHFEFVSSPLNSDRITGVNYSHDEAAAREVLTHYPGVSGEMVTLDLKVRTEQVAR